MLAIVTLLWYIKDLQNKNKNITKNLQVRDKI